MDNGALNSYVRRNRDLSWGFIINFYFEYFLLLLQVPKTPYSRRQLISFCADIASGMTYLAKNNVFHRDLAARNCLLDADLSVKGIFSKPFSWSNQN